MADIQVANTDADLSGNTVVTEENAYTITGLHTYSRSTNAPFACISGAAVVTYLDADKLDGQEGAYYLAATNATGTLAVNRGGTGAATFTDGGVLLGSGTSAITATAVLGDGVILIGDASGDPTTLDVGSSSGITILGTIATGVWQGTDVGVAYGGTGVSTLTDGGVLLGQGTGAIEAMAVLTDGQMIVGDGTTDPVAESGSTLRTSIGVGTGDSPTFTGLTVAQVDITGEGDLRLQDNTGGQYVGLDAPTAVSTSYTLTFPAAIGSVNQLLTINNVDGTLQWATASSASAAGSDTQVQFNDGGSAFGGDAGLTYNKTTNALTITGDLVVNTSTLFVDESASEVGIGTAAPSSLLTVQGPTGTGATPAGLLTLATSELTIVDNDQLGRIEFRSPIATAGTDAIVSAASIHAEANATFSTTVNSADLVFSTATSGAPTEAMRIDSGGDVFSTAYTDYYSSSTIVGWSSLTAGRRRIMYKTIGKLVFVWFHLEGTSNATNITFTLPYTSTSIGYGAKMFGSPLTFTYNNTVAVAIQGVVHLDVNSNVATCNLSPTANDGWTASGVKEVGGNFVYEMA
jgi:hypothetical protein